MARPVLIRPILAQASCPGKSDTRKRSTREPPASRGTVSSNWKKVTQVKLHGPSSTGQTRLDEMEGTALLAA